MKISVELSDEDWARNAWNYFRCRRAGLSPGTIDCLIATVAADRQVPLWTLDKGLLRLRKVIGFTEYERAR